MSDRTVLVIAYYFPPLGLSGVQRTVKFIKYLPDFGWKPIVLTSPAPAYYAFDDTLLEDLQNPEIEIFRTESKKSANNKKPKVKKLQPYFLQKLGRMLSQTFFQPDRFITWKKKAVALGEKIISENKIDAIFATAPPYTDFLVALELSKKFNIPFIVDYRDLWLDNPFNFYATPFHKMYNEKLEREILTHAQKAVVITRFAKESILKRYHIISHNDISIIPHGFDAHDFVPYQEIKPLPYKFTITHSGVFQDNRTPKYFLKALSNFIKKKPETKNTIEIRLIGVMRKGHSKYIKKYNLTDNIVAPGYLSHNEVIKNLKESDVLWLMLNDNARTPGKLYEYFGAEKPILATVPDGIMRKIALESKAAIATEPTDILAIEQAIETLYNLWKNKNLPKPKAGFYQQYDRKVLTSELARELSLISPI